MHVDEVFDIVTPAEGTTDQVYADIPTLAFASGGKVVQNCMGTSGTIVVPQEELKMGAAYG